MVHKNFLHKDQCHLHHLYIIEFQVLRVTANTSCTAHHIKKYHTLYMMDLLQLNPSKMFSLTALEYL